MMHFLGSEHGSRIFDEMHHQRGSAQKAEHEGAVDSLAGTILFDALDAMNLAGRELVQIEQALPRGIQT